MKYLISQSVFAIEQSFRYIPNQSRSLSAVQKCNKKPTKLSLGVPTLVVSLSVIWANTCQESYLLEIAVSSYHFCPHVIVPLQHRLTRIGSCAQSQRHYHPYHGRSLSDSRCTWKISIGRSQEQWQWSVIVVVLFIIKCKLAPVKTTEAEDDSKGEAKDYKKTTSTSSSNLKVKRKHNHGIIGTVTTPNSDNQNGSSKFWAMLGDDSPVISICFLLNNVFLGLICFNWRMTRMSA